MTVFPSSKSMSCGRYLSGTGMHALKRSRLPVFRVFNGRESRMTRPSGQQGASFIRALSLFSGPVHPSTPANLVGANKKRQLSSKSDENVEESPSGEGQTIPIGILKSDGDAVIRPDSEYPEWLFRVLDDMDPFKRKDVIDADTPWISSRQILRRQNTQKIKAENASPSSF